jgi:hypothetical protein
MSQQRSAVSGDHGSCNAVSMRSPLPLPLGTVPHPMRLLPAEDRQFQPIRNLILPLLIHVAFSFASQAVMFTAITIDT